MTGARFGGARRRSRAAAPAGAGSGPVAADQAAGAPAPAAPWDGGPDRRDGPAAGTAQDPGALPSPPGTGEPEPEPQEAGSAFVRPYVLTRGRTRSSTDLAIETLVSAVPQADPIGRGGLTGEHEEVLRLCREPRSVAELAALAHVPLGVARVLVGDLATAGVVAVHRSAGARGPDLALMERVLSGLRRL